MLTERVCAFLTRSHERVLQHCDGLLGRPLPEEQRSRLTALRAAAEADLRAWERSYPGRPGSGGADRALELG